MVGLTATFLDGHAVNPDTFGEFNKYGQWVAKTPTFANPSFDDGSPSNHKVAIHGNAQTTVGKYGQGFTFGSTSDYLKIPHTDEFVFGTGDFTVECWVSRSSSATGAILSQYEVRGWIMQVDSTNVIKWRDQYDGTSNMTGTTTISTDGTWYHVAVTRESGTFRMFVDGELEVTNVASYNYDTTYMTEDFLVGRYSNGNSSGLNGNVDDIRISNTARYTA